MLSKSLKLLGAAASIAALLLVGACSKGAKPEDAPKAEATVPAAKVEKATPVAPMAPAMKSEVVPAPKAKIMEESAPVKSVKKGKKGKKAKKGSKAKKAKKAKKGAKAKAKAKGKKKYGKKAKAKKAKPTAAAPAVSPAQ